jgi:hypothetical protein
VAARTLCASVHYSVARKKLPLVMYSSLESECSENSRSTFSVRRYCRNIPLPFHSRVRRAGLRGTDANSTSFRGYLAYN